MKTYHAKIYLADGSTKQVVLQDFDGHSIQFIPLPKETPLWMKEKYERAMKYLDEFSGINEELLGSYKDGK